MQEVYKYMSAPKIAQCTKGILHYYHACIIMQIAVYMLSSMPAATSNVDLLVDGLQPGGLLCTFQPGAKEQ